MASAQVVETSVTNNSPSQDSSHPDDLFQSIILLLKTGSLDNAMQDFFIGLAIMIYEPIHYNLQIW